MLSPSLLSVFCTNDICLANTYNIEIKPLPTYSMPYILSLTSTSSKAPLAFSEQQQVVPILHAAVESNKAMLEHSGGTMTPAGCWGIIHCSGPYSPHRCRKCGHCSAPVP